MGQNTAAQSAQAQQALQNILTNLTGAQTSVLSAQATLGTSLAEIQTVQTQNSSLSADASIGLSDLQSANLPQVLANYSESLTALQAAQMFFRQNPGSVAVPVHHAVSRHGFGELENA